jgi:hypothetical protein
VEVAGDTGVRTVGGSGDAVEGLLEEVGRGKALGEGQALVAEFGVGVEEDDFVGEVLTEEGAVEVRATFEQETEDVAFGERGEGSGEAEEPGVIGKLFDLDAERAEGGGLCGRGEGTAEDKEVGF